MWALLVITLLADGDLFVARQEGIRSARECNQAVAYVTTRPNTVALCWDTTKEAR